jgi:methylase of polypeptide subunit release factors
VSFDEHVLTPRPWTVAQSRFAACVLERVAPGPLLELHCGAGHIGQAAAVWSQRPIVQVDDSPGACEWARHNAATNGVDADVRQVSVDTLDVDADSFALVLADPPYVPTAETPRFADDPRHAIDGGTDGLAGVRACLPVAARLARSDGTVLLQVRGPEQARAVRREVEGTDLSVRATMTLANDRALVLLARR